jgi:two-component system response regulator FixJ
MATRTIHIVVDRGGETQPLEPLAASARFVPVTYVCPRTFIEIAPRLQGGCILIDVQQGHRLYARLRALGVRIPTIVLVDPDEIQVAVSVMKQGAFDVFERPADERALRFAMDRALRDTGPKDSMPENLDAMGRVAKLSNRERQVLDALAAGQASKAIAYELGISVRTIEVHRARMLQRLGVQNAAAAIRLAVIAECGTIAPTSIPRRGLGGLDSARVQSRQPAHV